VPHLDNIRRSDFLHRPPLKFRRILSCGLSILALLVTCSGSRATEYTGDSTVEPVPASPAPDSVMTAGISAAPPDLGTSPEVRLKLNILIYGMSYHTDRQGVRRENVDNELNVGLGLNYEFHEDEQGVGFVEAGFYRDSGRNWAKLAGPGYQFKVGKRLRLGGVLVGVQSPTYMNGKFFIAPLPMASYDLGFVKLNAVYIPRYRDYNQFAVFGLTFSIPFR